MRRLALLVVVAACGDNRAANGEFASGSRLRLVTYALSDGSSVVDRSLFHDAERDEDCRIAEFSSGARFCLPTSARGTTVFTESTCTRVIGAERTALRPPVYFVRPYLMHGETRPSRLYRVGDPIEAPAQVWQQQDGYCLGPYPRDPLLTYYAVGDVVTTDDLVAVRATDAIDTGRLSIAFDTSEDGWRAPGEITDEELALPCTLTAAPNAATTTCVPDLPEVSYYADSACRDPLVSDARALHHDLATGCTTIVDSGDVFTGTAFEQIGETCKAVPAPAATLYRARTTRALATLPRRDRGDTRIHTIELTDELHDELLHDTTLGADCALVDGVCAPVSTVDVRTYFSDAQCNTPVDVTFVPTGACELPSVFAGGRRVGDVYAAPIYEFTTGDRCDVYTPPSRFVVHVVGDAPTGLVTYERQR